MANKPHKPHETLSELAKAVAIGAAAFVLIFGVAILLGLLADCVSEWEIVRNDIALPYCLKGAKLFLLGADLSVFCAFVIKHGWRAIRKF